MLKRRMLALLAALVFTLAATGAAGIIGDSFGYTVTSPSYACDNTSTSGGC